jgi:microcystin-dependent protein
MSEPFIAEIRIFPYTFAPRGWAFCSGQLLPIAQNTALFSLVGTTYGGNGQTTFGLPNLQSRTPLGFDQGPGLSHYDLGEIGGVETVTLTSQQVPAHTHPVLGNTGPATTGVPNATLSLGLTTAAAPVYGPAQNLATMSSTGTAGSQPHGNRQPFTVLNFCIAIEGIFPSRN